MKARALLLCALSLLLVLPALSLSQLNDADKKLAHDLLQELIEINTTDSVGNVSTASEAMAKRFRDAFESTNSRQLPRPVAMVASNKPG